MDCIWPSIPSLRAAGRVSSPSRESVGQGDRGGRRGRAQPARPAALSLDIPTLKQASSFEPLPELLSGLAPGRLQWSAKLVSYEDGIKVVGFRIRPPCSGLPAGAVLQSPRVKVALDVRERIESSISRSRALVVHRTRCLAGRYLWTFTKRGKFESVDEMWRVWKEFRRLFELRFGRKLKYVAVPELHSDGESWHLHAAFNEWLDAVPLRILWFRALGGKGNERGTETPGNLDAKKLYARGGAVRRIASYIAKYVGKGFGAGRMGRRLFAASVGLNPIETVRWHSPYELGAAEFAIAVVGRVAPDRGLENCRCWFNGGPLIEVFVIQL